MTGLVIAVILGWSLFAFGAVYPWASRPVVLAAVALAVVRRPAICRRGTRWLDLSLIAVLLVVVAELVPLPPALVHALSPASESYRAALALIPPNESIWRPLSLVPAATAEALSLLAASLLLFWVTRESLRDGGTRALVRSIAWMGLAAALTAVTPWTNPYKVYGFWQATTGPAEPVGPMISRNHFASWLILALALTGGYLVAHARAHWRSRRQSAGYRMLSDARAYWLLAAGALMLVGLVRTQSRGGVIGFVVATIVGVTIAWRGLGWKGRAGILAYLVVLVIAAGSWAGAGTIAEKFDRSDSWGGRPEIWHVSEALFERYPAVGVGYGTFDVVMPVYQPTPRTYFINHAHNQYLQTLVEGGVALAAPAAVALIAFFATVLGRLRRDRGPLAHLRAGALAGILGLSVQAIWETPFLTPAVLFLLAVIGGLACAASPSSEAA